LIGTGAGNRVSLTFTPTAGSLTMTVVGSVTLAQLETGSTATAYQRVTTAFDVTEAGVQSVSYLFDDLVDDQINWTASAGTNYSVAWVDNAGSVTIQTAQSLSGTTDALRAQRMAGYLAINRALTAEETTNLTNWFRSKAGL
jgi:DNA-binding helix-hairpin-helix protein with protein kinase domain